MRLSFLVFGEVALIVGGYFLGILFGYWSLPQVPSLSASALTEVIIAIAEVVVAIVLVATAAIEGLPFLSKSVANTIAG